MAGTKRKSTDATNAGASSSKKARSIARSDAQSLVKAILAEPDTYPILDDDDDVRRKLVKLATYAKDLEEELSPSDSPAGPAPKTMTPDQLAAAVEKLRKAAKSGITKQMSWKPSCKTSSAKWVYDGVCNDPLVFGTLIGQGGPPKLKTYKIPVDEFTNLFGGIQKSARYSNLYITGSHINVRWSDSGEFKFSGTYGV